VLARVFPAPAAPYVVTLCAELQTDWRAALLLEGRASGLGTDGVGVAASG